MAETTKPTAEATPEAALGLDQLDKVAGGMSSENSNAENDQKSGRKAGGNLTNS